MLKKLLFVLFLCIYSVTLCAELPQDSKSCIVLTIPKSGTNLLLKLIRRMSNKQILFVCGDHFQQDAAIFPPHNIATNEKFWNLFKDINYSLSTHLNFTNQCLYFVSRRPEYVKILMIRDLRDVCVSTVYYIDSFLKVALGEHATFDQKLHYVIDGTGWLLANSVYNTVKEAQTALFLMSDPSFHVFRFEDLCGDKGGGSDVIQKEEIVRLAVALGIPVTQSEIEKLANDLWGESKTFRKGMMQSWKQYFKESHKQAFKKNLGSYLIQMGYEVDYNW